MDTTTQQIQRSCQFRGQIFAIAFASPRSRIASRHILPHVVAASLSGQEASHSTESQMTQVQAAPVDAADATYLFCLSESGDLVQILVDSAHEAPPVTLALPSPHESASLASSSAAASSRKVKKTDFCWSPDHTVLAVGRSDGSVEIYTTVSNHDQNSSVESAAAVATASYAGGRTIAFRLLRVLHDQTSTIYRLRFCPFFAGFGVRASSPASSSSDASNNGDHAWLASASQDGSVVIYNLADLNVCDALSAEQQQAASSFSYSPGKVLQVGNLEYAS